MVMVELPAPHQAGLAGLALLPPPLLPPPPYIYTAANRKLGALQVDVCRSVFLSVCLFISYSPNIFISIHLSFLIS